MKSRYAQLLIAVISAVAFFMPVIAGAADFSNRGFKKYVSGELKERFSMCDEFLDVKWVDRKRLTGIVGVDAYGSGRSERRFLIVRLEKPGSKAFNNRRSGIFYEIREEEYNSSGYANFLAGARQSFSRNNVFMNVAKGRKSERYPQEPLPFEAFANHRHEFPDRSFSGFTRTVCVAYPDEKKAFVVEARKPFSGISSGRGSKKEYDRVAGYANERCSEISADKTHCSLAGLKDAYALNLNGDRRDDYLFVISGGKGSGDKFRRYMMISSGDHYVVKNITGCFGPRRFLYGYTDGRVFHPGGCVR
jgi:hypothetical protein